MQPFPMKPWNSIGRRRWQPLALAALLAAALFAGSVGPVCAGDARLSFERVWRAQWHTSYAGRQHTAMSHDGREFSVEADVVQNRDGRRLVTVVSPESRAGELTLQSGAYQWRYNSKRNSVDLGPSQLGRHSAEDKKRQPDLTPIGIDTIAGRATVIYNVEPRHGSGITLKWWVDNATLVPLRTEITTRDGRQIVEEYEQITFGPEQRVTASWPHDADLMVRTWDSGHSGRPESVHMPVALPRIIPGAVLDGIWLRTIAGRRTLWIHLHRGHEDASIFETTGTPGAGNVPQGGGVQNWNLGALNITLVSHLPADVQNRIRDSMRIVDRP